MIEYTKKPMVSVIVPVYNAEANLKNLIESLISQDYPEENLEIIFVDNKSTDISKSIIESYRKIKMAEENNVQSSYASRNKGINLAKGEILAFTDSDCIADIKWVSEGVRSLTDQDADLAGGRVQFYYASETNPSAAEIFDSISNMQNIDSIRNKGEAKTANLFVKNHVFKHIGLFPHNAVSGGDVAFTGKASRNGFKLIYADEAVVKHPARKLNEFLKKQYRVGKGYVGVWKDNDEPNWKIVLLFLKLLLPPRIVKSNLIKLKEKGVNSKYKIFKVWLVAYLCKIASSFGFVVSVIRK